MKTISSLVLTLMIFQGIYASDKEVVNSGSEYPENIVSVEILLKYIKPKTGR